MREIELGETIDALRAELVAAVERGRDSDIQFPVGQIQLEFQIGVKRTGEGRAGVKFWVLEMGSGGALSSESLQKVTMTLEAPVDRTGRPLKISDATGYRP